jgi:hypothetical protein
VRGPAAAAALAAVLLCAPSPADAQAEKGLPFESAGRDRFFLGFTGYTLPASQYEFTVYDLFIWEFGYGIGDGLQVGAQLSPSLLSTAFFFSFSLRYQLASSGTLGLATYTSYTGLSLAATGGPTYSSAIMQGLALTGGSRRLLLNLPVAGIVTNVQGGAKEGCDVRLDKSCAAESNWRVAGVVMPGLSLLIAEPSPQEQIRGMVEVIAGLIPGAEGAWLVLANVGIRWEDRGYLCDLGVSIPVATGYGKPTGDVLRWGGWVIPLVDFSASW